MNNDFEAIKSILSALREDYIKGCQNGKLDSQIPITERDIVAEIYSRLKVFCRSSNELSTHCEIKPAKGEFSSTSELKTLPRIDNVILSNHKGKEWLSSAKVLQNKYRKGDIEARFSSVPVLFFHTAIEVKIQSNVPDAKKDIDTLKELQDNNKTCNCFFVLFNARGRAADHFKIKRYAEEKDICITDYTSS